MAFNFLDGACVEKQRNKQKLACFGHKKQGKKKEKKKKRKCFLHVNSERVFCLFCGFECFALCRGRDGCSATHSHVLADCKTIFPLDGGVETRGAGLRAGPERCSGMSRSAGRAVVAAGTVCRRCLLGGKSRGFSLVPMCVPVPLVDLCCLAVELRWLARDGPKAGKYMQGED